MGQRNAYIRAEEQTEYNAWGRDSLKEILLVEGFTEEEVDYAMKQIGY